MITIWLRGMNGCTVYGIVCGESLHDRNSVKEFILKRVFEASSVYMCSENRFMYDAQQ